MNKIKYSKEQAMNLRVGGMSYTEVAENMGCSLAWVKKALRGTPRGSIKIPVDSTRLEAIRILEEALEKVRGL